MKVGDRVKVTGCREGWSNECREREGVIVVADEGSTPYEVALDGLRRHRVFFHDELTIIEEATT